MDVLSANALGFVEVVIGHVNWQAYSTPMDETIYVIP